MKAQWMRQSARFLTGILLGLTLVSCEKDEAQVYRDKYQKDFSKVFDMVKEIRGQTRGMQVYRENYKKKIKELMPKINPILDQYRKLPLVAERNSFKYMNQALDNYIAANDLWSLQKGMILILPRWDEGNKYLTMSVQAFADETGEVLEGQKDSGQGGGHGG